VKNFPADHFVANCPVTTCSWTSDPLPSSEQASEARRGHVNDHTHGELVDHICSEKLDIARYARVPLD